MFLITEDQEEDSCDESDYWNKEKHETEFSAGSESDLTTDIQQLLVEMKSISPKKREMRSTMKKSRTRILRQEVSLT